MREDSKPGDMSVRLGFGRVYGSGPDRGQIKPTIEIEDECSGKSITLHITAEDLAELFAGGRVCIPAASIQGFEGARDWGKRHEMKTVLVDTQSGDWKVAKNEKDAVKLPHVAGAIAALRWDGYRCDAPRRNNSNKWVIVGRRYIEQ